MKWKAQNVLGRQSRLPEIRQSLGEESNISIQEKDNNNLKDPISTIANGIANGFYSLYEDLVLGIQRTGEGLGLGKNGRVTEIGHENYALKNLLIKISKHGLSSELSPLYCIILIVLEAYYSHYPEETLTKIAKQSKILISHKVGRTIIGKTIAKKTAIKIAMIISSSALYKSITAKTGLSSSFSATGIGVPISLILIQGTLQRASHSAYRLYEKCPELYLILQRNDDLHLLYFMIEKPMEKYINGIMSAKFSIENFQNLIRKDLSI